MTASFSGELPLPPAKRVAVVACMDARLLGTKEIILIHHADCSILTFTDDGFKAHIQ